jgi:hypothetical protein
VTLTFPHKAEKAIIRIWRMMAWNLCLPVTSSAALSCDWNAYKRHTYSDRYYSHGAADGDIECVLTHKQRRRREDTVIRV